ncbi:MAG: T9SS type A sorting domain-containing protein [Chitinispirillaceae bacterium]|nr:T9SS type A sorting domain-containing protein [Chitinispirillaceae bacterium]
MLQYFFGPVEFAVCSDGIEEMSNVQWLIDSASDARNYGKTIKKPDTVSLGLDDYFNLAMFPSDTVHTLTARITAADSSSVDIVWRFIMVPTEFNLFMATVKVEDEVDTIQGDSIFTLSFGDTHGFDTTIFSTEYDNCGNMCRVGGFRFDTVDISQAVADTLQINAFSETYDYAQNNTCQYILPFLDKKNSMPLCQVLYIGSARKRFAFIPVPFSTTVDEPPFSLEQAYQDYLTASPLKLRIDPVIVRDVRQRIITCPTVVTNQDASRLIAWYDENYWYFEESQYQYDMHSYFSYSYSQQFKIDTSSEVVTVSCSERCEGLNGLTCNENRYCPSASVAYRQTAAQSSGNPYRIIGSKSNGSFRVVYRSQDKPIGISVYSLAGKLYYHTSTVGRSSAIIRFSDYPSGVYVVTVNGNRECGLNEYRFIVPVAAHF